MKEKKSSKDILEYQPDAVEIEERPVPGKIRWVLYLIVMTVIATIVGAVIFKVDRIVVSQGELVTNTPTIVVQPLSTAVIRTINVQIGDVVGKGQILATLDPTFATADLSQLRKQQMTLEAQIRRIKAELQKKPFAALPKEYDDGKLQEQVHLQRRLILETTKKTAEDKIAALRATLRLKAVERQGIEQQQKVLRDIEGTIAKRPQHDEENRLRLLEAQKTRIQGTNAIETLKAEEEVTRNELRQAESDWQRFLQERNGELIEQEVTLRNDLAKVEEELHKAERMHDLISLKSPERGIVLKLAERSVGSILQQAEPFITLVPTGSILEAEVYVDSKDIGRIRTGDMVRVKLDAFPFQRHETLPGKVRVISENAFQKNNAKMLLTPEPGQDLAEAYYRTRITLLSTQLRNVPDGFRLIPGMKVRAEIKVGKRSIISYFLYPIIRALDESLREP
ncbi:MAG: HlyD family type I secretion periplasmic adaptor subunit [Desulfobulbus sp.]|nr:HlyD family type I secretion periplasmic adaptor subunit [Desulfobulbus sp.]